jgi:TetR/AcrR family transcriptional repressor of nem operon
MSRVIERIDKTALFYYTRFRLFSLKSMETIVRKGEQTKELILARTAPVFNRLGYYGARLDDILRATGLEKGGIYNHFASKDDLALAAFDYAIGLVERRFERALDGKRNAIDRLLAIVSVFHDMIEDPPVPGGCPLLNTAVESDDAHPRLRERARKAMDAWYGLTRRVVAKGIERQEIRPETDPDSVATMMISSLEGAIMMSKLYGDSMYIRRAVEHLNWYIESCLRV